MAKVLIIDESETAMAAASALLERAGHETLHHARFANLLEVMAMFEPALVLLELRMHGFSGMQYARLIAYRPTPPPIILYSSGPRAELVKAGLEMGCAAIVQKEHSESRLVAMVRSVLAAASSSAGPSEAPRTAGS